MRAHPAVPEMQYEGLAAISCLCHSRTCLDTEQKRELVEALTKAIVETCGADREGTSVVIEEYERDDWARGGVLISDR